MQTKGGEAIFDPICGREVHARDAQCIEHKKHTYFFCSSECREIFERRAERHRVHELARMGALFAEQKVRWGRA